MYCIIFHLTSPRLPPPSPRPVDPTSRACPQAGSWEHRSISRLRLCTTSYVLSLCLKIASHVCPHPPDGDVRGGSVIECFSDNAVSSKNRTTGIHLQIICWVYRGSSGLLSGRWTLFVSRRCFFFHFCRAGGIYDTTLFPTPCVSRQLLVGTVSAVTKKSVLTLTLLSSLHHWLICVLSLDSGSGPLGGACPQLALRL